LTVEPDAGPTRQRATNRNILALRRARQLAAPFQKRIGPWQERLAHLRTLRLFHPERDVRAQAADLLPLVGAARIELEAVVTELEDDVLAQQSSIASLREALSRLCNELQDLQR
jgi:hypothetical protein